MNGNERVKLAKVIEKMHLENITPQIDVSEIWLHVPEVNRPALQLTGFYDQFDILRALQKRSVLKDITSCYQAIFHVLYSAEA